MAVVVSSIVVLALALLPASAVAEIVAGRSIAGVKLGASKASVRHKLGQPLRSLGATLFYAKPCLCSVSFRQGQVHDIDTLSKSQRTDKGIGPGVSFEKTVAAYPEANCYHPHVYGETSQFCVLHSTYQAQTVKTVFAFFEKDLPMRDVEIRLG